MKGKTMRTDFKVYAGLDGAYHIRSEKAKLYLWRDGTVHTGTGVVELNLPSNQWNSAPGYWPTREAAEKFLREWEEKREQ